MGIDNWRERRFVKVVSDEHNALCKHLIILTDVAFWAENVDDLVTWCEEHKCTTQGMTVEIENDHTFTLFCLRWS